MSKRRGIESTTASASASASTSEQDDEFYGFFGDEPQKAEGALALALCAMKWEDVDEATILGLRKITRANIMARDALMGSSKKKERIIIGNKKVISKKQRKIISKEVKFYDIRKFKKPLLGFGFDDCELPILPPVERLRGVVGICSKPFEKVLTNSDVNDRHCRLTLVRSYTIETIVPLLDEVERNKLDDDVKIDVTTFDQHGKEYDMAFQKWAGGKFYVLRGRSWKAFFHDNSLEAGTDWVAVWSFRHLETGRLCFAIVARRIPVKEEEPIAMLGRIPVKEEEPIAMLGDSS